MHFVRIKFSMEWHINLELKLGDKTLITSRTILRMCPCPWGKFFVNTF